MRKILGKILLAKRLINLETKFLETPKFVEDDEYLEMFYEKA